VGLRPLGDHRGDSLGGGGRRGQDAESPMTARGGRSQYARPRPRGRWSDACGEGSLNARAKDGRSFGRVAGVRENYAWRLRLAVLLTKDGGFQPGGDPAALEEQGSGRKATRGLRPSPARCGPIRRGGGEVWGVGVRPDQGQRVGILTEAEKGCVGGVAPLGGTPTEAEREAGALGGRPRSLPSRGG